MVRPMYRLLCAAPLTLALNLAPASNAFAAGPAETAFTEGSRFLAEKNYPKAIAALTKATKLDPQRAEAWADLGNAYLGQENYSSAAQAFGEAVKIKPDFQVARYNYAYSLRQLGEYKKAAEQYQSYLQRAPEDADAYYGLAESLKADGQLMAAADAYDGYAKAEKRPGQQQWIDQAKKTAADVRAQAKKKEAPSKVAAAPAPKAPAPAPKTAAPASAKATPSPKAATTQNNAQGLAKAEKTLLGKRPVAFRTALSKLQNNKFADALGLLEPLVQNRSNDSMVLAAAAAAHLGLGEAQEAKKLYQRAINHSSPEAMPALLLGLSEAERLLDNEDRAEELLRQAKKHPAVTAELRRVFAERS